MKLHLLLLFLLCGIVCFGQSGTTTVIRPKNITVPYQSPCNYSGSYCLDCGTPKATFKQELTSYFKKRIDKRKMEWIDGLIAISVMIDTNGKACCLGFSNNTANTPEDILALGLDSIINNMPLWQPALKDGKPYYCSLFIGVFSHVKGRRKFEVDYLRIPENMNWKPGPLPTEMK